MLLTFLGTYCTFVCRNFWLKSQTSVYGTVWSFFFVCFFFTYVLLIIMGHWKISRGNIIIHSDPTLSIQSQNYVNVVFPAIFFIQLKNPKMLMVLILFRSKVSIDMVVPWSLTLSKCHAHSQQHVHNMNTDSRATSIGSKQGWAVATTTTSTNAAASSSLRVFPSPLRLIIQCTVSDKAALAHTSPVKDTAACFADLHHHPLHPTPDCYLFRN